eukprot:jgi/Galph1/5072/GphlegSOOS_G3727.1
MLRFLSRSYGIRGKGLRFLATFTAKDTSYGYCLNMLRQYDHDQFLINLLQPKQHRRAHAAIRAFNIELTRIRQVVTNEDLGYLRIAFFREAIEKVYAGVPDKQPVLDLLTETVMNYAISKKWLEQLLTAREADLSVPNPQTIEDLESFAEATQSSLLYAYLETFGKENLEIPQVQQAASHLGQSLGLTILIRGTRHHIQSRQCYFPRQWTRQYAVDLSHLFQGNWNESTGSIVQLMTNRAKFHLEQSRKLSSSIPSQLFSAFLSASIVDVYLRKVEKYHFDALNDRLGIGEVEYFDMSQANEQNHESDADNQHSSQLIVRTVAGPGTGPPIPIPCKYYLEGFCVHGNSCRFLHDNPRNESSNKTQLSKPVLDDFVKLRITDSKESTDKDSTNLTSSTFSQVYASLFADSPTTPVEYSRVGDQIHAVASSSYANRVLSNTVSDVPTEDTTQQVQATHSLKVPILCKYHADNQCQYGMSCHYLHGLECPHCGRNVLHPIDHSVQQQHLEECRLFHHSSDELSDSRNQACGICLDYPRRSGKSFGLLESCEHVFCLECIRQWRQHILEFGQMVRYCPLCRTPSYFVIPSLTVPSNAQRKEEIIQKYKDKLATIPCKYFNYGKGTCPFSTSCFYSHTFPDGTPVNQGKPRRYMNADGELIYERPRSLAEFMVSKEKKKR